MKEEQRNEVANTEKANRGGQEVPQDCMQLGLNEICLTFNVSKA